MQDVYEVGMKSVGGQAFAHALASGALNRLERVLLTNKFDRMGDGAMAEVIKGLASPGACPNLLCLYAYSKGIGHEASKALVEGLWTQAWPALQELDVALETLVGEAWLCDMAGALLNGGGRHLVRLTVCCPVSARGLERLCEAFQQGACYKLQDFSMVGVPVGDGVDKKTCIQRLEEALQGRVVLDVEWAYDEEEGDSSSCDSEDSFDEEEDDYTHSSDEEDSEEEEDSEDSNTEDDEEEE